MNERMKEKERTERERERENCYNQSVIQAMWTG